MTASQARSFRPEPEDSRPIETPTAGLSPLREMQLVEASRAGDAEAVAELLRAYQRRVFGVCYRMVRHPEDAADLTQDTLIRIMEGLPGFDGRAAFSTWVIRIAMNCCLSHLRRQKVRKAGSLDEPGGPAGEPLGARIASKREPQGPGGVEQNEMRAALLAGLQELDPQMRAVLVLRDLQDLDYQQITEVMGIPVGTVKSRLFRARAALRRATDRIMGEPESSGPARKERSERTSDG